MSEEPKEADAGTMEGERGETDRQTSRQTGRQTVSREGAVAGEDKARKTQADKDRGGRGW